MEISKSDARDMFYKAIRGAIWYWLREERTPSVDGKLDGLAFSILNIIDGTGMQMPAIDLILRPHPEDKSYHEAKGEDWFADGMCINDDVLLHELWHKS